MTSNDPGHVNNLDATQRDALKSFWLTLTLAIEPDPSKLIESELGDELFYLCGRDHPDAILLRWLRARKWNVSAAVQHLIDTLRWRHDWGLQKLIGNGEADLNLEESASGKLYLMGKDKEGRLVTYFHISDHVRGQYPYECTEKLVILLMETGRHLAESNIEEATVVIDMTNLALQNMDYQHIKFTINAMQNYYPECLGAAIIVNAPWGFNTMTRIIKPWLDPVVASKFQFTRSQKDLSEYIEPENIPERLGGKHPNFKFIPPTKEDENRMMIIRQDQVGMSNARLKYRQAAQHFLNITLAWAATSSQTQQTDESDRTEAAKRLRDTFTELLPYISTRTHYHRTEEIREPIFDLVYNRILKNDNQTTYF